jgi:single-strand DNA-binding protein
MADNTVTVVGNVTRDPELRFTNTGQGLASFGLAVNRRWQNRQSGEWEEQTSFLDITAWGEMGENIAQSIHKGDRLLVTGRLQQRSYETQSGEKRSVVEIVADEVGPSLRWATATVIKPDRSQSGDRNRGGGSGSGGGGRSADPGPTPPPAYANDEEPF